MAPPGKLQSMRTSTSKGGVRWFSSPWYCRNTLPGYWKGQPLTSTHMHEQPPSLEGAEDLWGENKSPPRSPWVSCLSTGQGLGVGTLGWGDTACSPSSAPETSTHRMCLPIRTWGTKWVPFPVFLFPLNPLTCDSHYSPKTTPQRSWVTFKWSKTKMLFQSSGPVLSTQPPSHGWLRIITQWYPHPPKSMCQTVLLSLTPCSVPGFLSKPLASPFLSSTEAPLNTPVPSGSPMALTQAFSLLPWTWPQLQGLHFHPPQSCPQGTF